MHCTRKVTDDLIWIGADDRRLACFEGVYDVAKGVSYNSYLLLDEKTVVFDTVDKAVSGRFFENIAFALNGRKLDYLVVDHMEPDHSATVEELMLRYPETKLVCSEKIRAMLGQYFTKCSEDRMVIVNEGDTLCTGRHTLTFVMAPMVHWPEVMMTYDLTDKILFSADAFGTFGALNGHLFNDEVDFFGEYLDEARRYYTNIVGKYGPQVQAILKKAAGLELNIICPLHGFVWHSHFSDFLDKYLRWSSYTPEETGVMLAYASVYGHTENAVNILACMLAERGIKTKVYDTSVTPASYIVADAFKYSHLVFASTTYNAGIFVTMENLLHDIANHALEGRKVAFIENGSWAPNSGALMKQIIAPLPKTAIIGNTATIMSALADGQEKDLEALADIICRDIKPAAPAKIEEPVDNNVFAKFNYGVEVLTTRVDGKDYGCIINTAGQVAACDPKKITISVIKKNNTCDMVAKAGKFNISILTQDVPFKLLQRFGFQSGRDVDKFEGIGYDDRMSNGIRYIPEYTNAVLSCEVIDVKDVETQILYIANVVEAKVLSDAPSCTYGYYHAHIKPKKGPAAGRPAGYVCKVCGHFEPCDGELPEGYTCPLCNHGAEEFEFTPAEETSNRKGFYCDVCGHFEPCDGELPDDYVCAVCNHGKESMVPGVG